jgi:mono/diheme cytochrome c family protein
VNIFILPLICTEFMKCFLKPLFLGIVFLIITTFGCTHDPNFSSAPKIYFSEIQAIFNQQCASCHGIGGDQHLIDSAMLMSYVVPFEPLRSKLYMDVANIGGRLMPQPPGVAIPIDQRTKIYLWILQGADPTSKKSNGGINQPNDSVSFVSDVLPVFVSKCSTTGCHDAITRREGYNFSSYSGLLARGIVPYNSGASRAFTAMNSTGESFMPPSPNPAVTTREKALILKWINEGAKNTNFTNNCDTTKFTFTDVNQIIQSSCVGCHSGASAGGGIQLTTYALIKVIADNGRLIAVLTQNTMPKGAPLSDCKKKQIEKWVAAGSLNN